MSTTVIPDSRSSVDVSASDFKARISFTISLPAEASRIQETVKIVKSRIQHFSYPQSILDLDIPLALTEAIANAVVHGNKGDKEKEVTVSVQATRRKFRCTVIDEGQGFDHTKPPDLGDTTISPASHGRGIYLIKSLMSSVSFNNAGNEIKMLLIVPQNRAS